MTDKHNEADEILSALESEMALTNLANRGEYAAGIAVCAGNVLTVALASGVPYILAKEMASDFWKAEMLADTVAALLIDSNLEEEGEDE
ncbi:hypothetical protein ACFYW9_19465 [Streptomyces sp. NPDC002698]|uniref:hypothetical protein n=1 Tax=Streptomyces sp. NPDC002698 TaxID=3364660 RepID=UPI0036D09263